MSLNSILDTIFAGDLLQANEATGGSPPTSMKGAKKNRAAIPAAGGQPPDSEQVDLCPTVPAFGVKNAMNIFGLTPDALKELSAHSLEHPDDPFVFPLPMRDVEGKYGELFSVIELTLWSRNQVETVVTEAQASFDQTIAAINAVVRELERTWQGRSAALEMGLDIDLASFEDKEIDRAFINNAFNLTNVAIQHSHKRSRENPDMSCPFPQPIADGKKQFFSLVELLRWHRFQVETAITKASTALQEANEALSEIVVELQCTWLGRRAILEKLLNVDLTNLDVHEEDGEVSV